MIQMDQQVWPDRLHFQGWIWLNDKFGKHGQGACRDGFFLAEKQFAFGIELRRGDLAFSAPRFNREPT